MICEKQIHPMQNLNHKKLRVATCKWNDAADGLAKYKNLYILYRYARAHTHTHSPAHS